ncbi:PDZ/DHR/GLGF domain protein [Dictyocaulus viviparus]|uniref:PDZ/DHR/GLGF domain protein n=1 Tax=Dictyocaulus viviparus TaxID=29172 RepID=A0A0D8XL99_DICVI|nr:PDZ/DHR/GLGF domain protein [Dictyocaulus viviparus]
MSSSLYTYELQALNVFLRENWQNTNYSTIDVDLVRDAALGLGITVAGYVHRKEEIGGIFVKSLVPRSAAFLSGLIRVHDLILEVNGISLEHLSHADSVRTLVKSGEHVHLRLIRFPPDSDQTQCLKMLQEQLFFLEEVRVNCSPSSEHNLENMDYKSLCAKEKMELFSVTNKLKK